MSQSISINHHTGTNPLPPREALLELWETRRRVNEPAKVQPVKRDKPEVDHKTPDLQERPAALAQMVESTPYGVKIRRNSTVANPAERERQVYADDLAPDVPLVLEPLPPASESIPGMERAFASWAHEVTESPPEPSPPPPPRQYEVQYLAKVTMFQQGYRQVLAQPSAPPMVQLADEAA